MPAERRIRPGRAADAVSILGSPAMRGPLQDLLRSRGLSLEHWEHLRTHHRPGGAVSALYRVRCSRRVTGAAGAGTASEAALTLHLGATTVDPPGNAAAAPGRSDTAEAPAGFNTAAARIAGLDLHLWFHPHDPVLPSLPWATDADAVARDVFGAGGPARLSLVAYRPLRRAVVRAQHSGGAAYLKLLPPAQMPALYGRHRLLEGSGVPAPQLMPGVWAPERDAAILSALPGTSLFRLLLEDSAAPVRPEVLLELLDALPAAALDLPLHRPWAERTEAYAEAAAASVPAERNGIFELARGIREVAASAPTGPLVPVHGDFHEGNLLLSGGAVTGLLDVDGLGPGHRVDDLACLLGHLAVLAAANPSRPQLARAFTGYRQVFEGAVDPAALNARAAGVVLTLVSGARAGNGMSRTHNAGIRLAAARQLLRAAGH